MLTQLPNGAQRREEKEVNCMSQELGSSSSSWMDGGGSAAGAAAGLGKLMNK